MGGASETTAERVATVGQEGEETMRRGVRSRRARRARLVLSAVLTVASVTAGTARAHGDGDHGQAEQLSFNRPEAWALKYFASATLMSGLETPRTRDPWSVSFGAEIGWLPSVSDSQRFVGFNGTKQEDLNKA